MKKTLFLLTSFTTAIQSLAAAPIFNPSAIMSLEDFGVIPNNYTTIQATAPGGSSYNIDKSTTRTNDYQNLQLGVPSYDAQRAITRIGAFLVSLQGTPPEGPAGGLTAGGPGVAFPTAVNAAGFGNLSRQLVLTNSPAISDGTSFVFSTSETPDNTFDTVAVNTGLSTTAQALTATYSDTSQPGKSIVDYCVTGNAFHDVYYDNLKPIIQIDSASFLQEVKVYIDDTLIKTYTLSSSGSVDVTSNPNPQPPSNLELEAGNKFVLTVLNRLAGQNPGDAHPANFVLYLQPPNNGEARPSATFKANFGGAAPLVSGIPNQTMLYGESSFSGFFRIAAVSVEPIPYITIDKDKPISEVTPDWSTALGINVIAATPGMMYLLWPNDHSNGSTFTDFSFWQIYEFTKFLPKSNAEIEIGPGTFLPVKYTVPTCPWYSIFVPLLATGNETMSVVNDTSGSITTVNRWAVTNFVFDLLFYESIALKVALSKNPNATIHGIPLTNIPQPFDAGTNPFLAYWNFLMGKYFSGEVETYQQGNRPIINYNVTATVDSVIACYDDHRDVIPTNTELSFSSSELTYQWDYSTITANTPSGPQQTDPLIIFPFYKRLNEIATLKSEFKIQDPVKGALYGASASSNKIVFLEGNLPDFMSGQTPSYFPTMINGKDVWDTFSSKEQKKLKELLIGDNFTGDCHFAGVLYDDTYSTPIKINSAIGQLETYGQDGYGDGKIMFASGLTLLYGAYVLDKLGMDSVAITKPLADAMKNAFGSWLYGFQRTLRDTYGNDPALWKKPNCPPPNDPNAECGITTFIGDSTVGGGGVCYSVRGMTGGTDDAIDFGNGVYNDHHFANGYWIGTAAALAIWDINYSTESTPWLALMAESGAESPSTPNFIVKKFVDIIWRDVHNPDPEDPYLPYDRYAYPWAGHSTASGLQLGPRQTGRNEESLAEDFNCWINLYYYADAVIRTKNESKFTTNLTDDDIQGFSFLKNYAAINMAMTSSAGHLWYNTPFWPYKDQPFGKYKATAAMIDDAKTDSDTFFGNGVIISDDPSKTTPPCHIDPEINISDPCRCDEFYEDYF